MMKLLLMLLPFLIVAAPSPRLGDPITMIKYETRYGEEETSSDPATSYSNIYSSYSERLVFYYTNLYRIDPGMLKNEDTNQNYKQCGDWGDCYPPTKPLFFNLDLSRAARYHSHDMRSNGECFEHTDCCVLNNSCPAGEDGSFASRIKKFYSGTSFGENIAAGHNYSLVVKNLINEVGASPGTDGHRHNIFGYQFNQDEPDFLTKGHPISYNEVGIGNLEGGYYTRYVTQNFGNAATRTEGFVAGIHTPQYPAYNSETEFNTIFHHPVKPRGVYLIINDIIYPMTLNQENPKSFKGEAINWFSGNYHVKITFPKSGCIPYHFQVIDHQSNRHKYPDSGQLMAGSGCNTKIYATTETTVDVTNINTGACEQNVCNEPFKTVCVLTVDGASCSCDPGYNLVGNECKKANSGSAAISGNSGFCNFNGEKSYTAAVFLLMMLLLIGYRRKIEKS